MNLPPIEPLLTDLLLKAFENVLAQQGTSSSVVGSFEVPREEKFGDLSSNAVMRLAKQMKISPRPLAEKILAETQRLLKNSPLARRIEKSAVEGPGFLNFYYSTQEIASVLLQIREKGENFGKPSGLKSKKILLEFVSANPTGPLTVAHGRQAALGDSLALILKYAGHKVDKEYYNNDEGVQINTLAASLKMRVERLVTKTDLDLPLPENYYQGEYLVDIAKKFIEKFHPAPPFEKFQDKYQTYARDLIMEGIKKDLDNFNVSFDSYYSQETLGHSGKVEQCLEELKKKGFVYESEGAVWFKSTSFGDDKDRVLVKSDKTYTYLLPDIAYHRDKLERKYEFLINILGPDHHGYIQRIKAAVEALGYSRDMLEIKIAQLVTLFEGDKQLRMSTRAGEFITLRELLDEVGRDAGRFFFLMRRFDAHLDFDLTLAKSHTMDNPVFYIQYAHARIENIKNLCIEKNIPVDKTNAENLALLSSVSETQLLRCLRQFPEAVRAAERDLEPFKLIPYLQELAGAFHRFYADSRVVTDDKTLTEARIMLAAGTQTVLRTGLRLLGVSAPAKM